MQRYENLSYYQGMMKRSYEQLRQEFPVFEYQAFDFSIAEAEIKMQFHFATGGYEFHPKMKLSLGKYAIAPLREEEVRGIVFQIGMIELISYWKCTCSPTVLVKPCQLDEAMRSWWKQL